MTTSLEDAIAIARKQANVDNSEDAIIQSFLEAGAAKCTDGSITYRPYMAAAFLMFTTQYKNVMSDRYRLGLIEGDGAKWINPLEPIKEYLIGMLRIQKALDCNYEECIPQCWKADKLIDDINCGCKGSEAEKPSYSFSAIVI